MHLCAGERNDNMASKEKRKRHVFGKIFAIIIIAVLIIGAAMSGIILSEVNSVKLSADTSVTVAEGDGASAVAAKLKNAGIIKYPTVFKLKSRFGGYDGKFTPGEAIVKNGMSYDDILKLMSENDRDSVKITIPEGFTVKQIRERLSDAGLIDTDKFDKALNPDDYNYKFLKNLPERKNKLEGYLFPSTYYITKGMSEHDIINMMLAEFDAQFKDEYYDRAKQMGYTTDEIVTMASIIEKETDSAAERAKVAGVFYNRLNSDMKLQSCATVQYILGTAKPVLSVADTQTESPYNTYLHGGLPIGPICNPEAACIEAALYPEKTDAYYFVLGANGEHIFSKTYEEHEAAMKRAAE